MRQPNRRFPSIGVLGTFVAICLSMLGLSANADAANQKVELGRCATQSYWENGTPILLKLKSQARSITKRQIRTELTLAQCRRWASSRANSPYYLLDGDTDELYAVVKTKYLYQQTGAMETERGFEERSETIKVD